MLPFETERLIVRKLEQRDIDNLYNYRKLDIVSKYQSWDEYSLKDATNLVAYANRFPVNGRSLRMNFGVEFKETHELIGDIYIGCSFLSPKKMTIGYTFNPDYWHQGLAYEAVYAMLHKFMEYYHKDECNAFVRPQNDASIRLLTKLGFIRGRYDEEFDDVEFIYKAIY